MIDLSIYRKDFTPFEVPNVTDIRYYNMSPLKGRFMNVEADIPQFSEFVKQAYHYTGLMQDVSPWTECIVLNHPDYLTSLDTEGNYKYAVCLLHSETFFNYFVPSLKYKEASDYDNYVDRCEYITDIRGFFDEANTKEMFIDWCLEGPISNVMSKIIIQDQFGNYMIDRTVLWYQSLGNLKETVDNFNYFIQGGRTK